MSKKKYKVIYIEEVVHEFDYEGENEEDVERQFFEDADESLLDLMHGYTASTEYEIHPVQ